tara:strand:+ start:9253 stop:11262 length:2010 start_codon:yes stop_codon:yes gene_type:complete
VAPAFFFLVAMIAYTGSGCYSLLTAPTATNVVGEFTIPDDAHCLRANRHADYTSVELNVGTPFSLLNVMLRLDRMGVLDDGSSTLRLFSSHVAESDTVSCTANVCMDAALMQTGGPTSEMKRSVVQFDYTNPTNEALLGGTSAALDMDGELIMAPGFDYYLTATHFCWHKLVDEEAALSKASETARPVNASVNNITRTLYAHASQLVWSETLRNTPAGLSHYLGRCINTSTGDVGPTALFPGAAASESMWLGFGSSRVYEDSPDGVEERRIVVEVGTDCAASYTGYQRAYSLYSLDCQSAYTPCETYPTVPMRRVASDEMRILTINDSAYLWTCPSTRLVGLPRLEDATDAVFLAIVKLFLMTLAAAIVWIRAAKSTSSHDMLFLHCVRTAHCEPYNAESPVSTMAVWEDAFIGLIAIGARLGVAIWRLETLHSDNQSRVAWVQLGACALSFLQWFTRYFLLQRQCETPLTKLGGSTALCDASTAVMLAFAEPPLLLSSIGRFDPTARLLTALLLTIVTLQRCLYASACCGLLWAVAKHDKETNNVNIAKARIRLHGLLANSSYESRFSAEYEYILLGAAMTWVLQAASVGILLADVFAVPLAHSSARSLAGEWLPIAYVFFFSITVASMPELVKTSEKIAQAPTKLVTKVAKDAELLTVRGVPVNGTR